ncbi:MAG: DEAD/DEAH box helicase family protein, partial [Deltaproteobacteria bacterium]
QAEKPSAEAAHNISKVDNKSPLNDKIRLFRSLFRGREDVYPKLWVSNKNGSTGYSPVCGNEWMRGICNKPAVRCSDCSHRKLTPLTDQVIQKHLEGKIVIGVYPLLQDDTCCLLAIDFDGRSWKDDVKAFLTTCKDVAIPASPELSRSGNGAHVWIFFSELVPAVLARQLGSSLITRTMNLRHELDMKSYDRLFPNQDTLPKGGFGNLIALPLQNEAMLKGATLFMNNSFVPYSDQWEYLSGVKRLSLEEMEVIARDAKKTGNIIGIGMSPTEDDMIQKGNLPRKIHKILNCVLPRTINAILKNRIYIEKDGLPSVLLNHFKRLAAFQNPEFYKRQGMRLSTALTPRIISCTEETETYIAIPRGCLEDMISLCETNNISLNIDDRRSSGKKIDISFQGELSQEQQDACKKLLKHDMGILVAPPGVGKTVIAIGLIVSRKINTLVLVHRKPLLEQWCAQLASFLGMAPKEIGQIGGGKDNPTHVVDVGMIQSLDKHDEIDSRIKNYGQIIIDECHHVSAFSFERVMLEANAKYICGLTATPFRRDRHHPIIMMQCGPIRHKVTGKDSSQTEIRKSLITRYTDFTCPWSEEDKIHSLWPFLIKDEERNQMIVNDIIDTMREKRSPIVLTERKEHLEMLRQSLQDSVKHIIVLHGGMKASARKEMIAMLSEIPDTEERLILATGQYIGEGFDDPRLDTLFLAMPFSFKGKMIQYTGRLYRQYKGKSEIRIYDYVDRNIDILSRMYERRLKTYKLLEYIERAAYP